MSKTLTFKFDRYINGALMAEGVTIERQPTFDKACVRAAELASYGKNGEIPVLVYRGHSFTAEAEKSNQVDEGAPVAWQRQETDGQWANDLSTDSSMPAYWQGWGFRSRQLYASQPKASPEMVELVKEMVPYLETIARSHHAAWQPEMVDEDSILGRAYAAIAAAQGVQS